MLFPLGKIVATKGVLDTIPMNEILDSLNRHVNGDWGNLCQEDKDLNDGAVVHGGRILSSYVSSHGDEFWIITEADRSVTTILLPNEY